MSAPYALFPVPSRRSRAAFTLVELLVSISIIGILSALALGGMYRANVAVRETNSKTTVNKVAAQVNEIWESYRNRKLPINPALVLQPSSALTTSPYYVQYTNSINWLNYYAMVRTTAGVAPIYVTGNAPNPGSNMQVAALRLAITHELMRIEMPCRFLDFTDTPSAINSPIPPGAINSGSVPAVTTTLVPQPYGASGPLANPGGLSEQYRQFFISHYDAQSVPYDPATSTYEPAECLYMIIKFASQNEIGQKSITDDPRLVGDADGDGMPEIQDAFNAAQFTAPRIGAAYTQHNKPISFLRWPLGFISDLQPQPALPWSSSSGWSTSYNYEYAAQRHDIFDPLRIDPRAVALTPLVYSAGPDTENGLFDYVSGYSSLLGSVTWDDVNGKSPIGVTYLPQIINDPYYIGTPTLPGLGFQMDVLSPSPMTGAGNYVDNITNHVINTRAQ